MQSKLVDALKLDSHAVAVIHTDDRPAGALSFEPGKWACVITMFAAAARGKTVAFDRQTYGCSSGGVGLCLAGRRRAPGRRRSRPRAPGRAAARAAHIKTPALAQQFIDHLPRLSIAQQYVVLKPLGEVDQACETPVLVVIFATADQVSALHFMANYARSGGEAVYLPWGAGCHTLHLWPYLELGKAEPRAVLGGTDMTARPHLDSGTLSFAIPWPLFCEMENNVPGSFMTDGDWPRLLDYRARNAPVHGNGRH
jgi:uncharacterized protein (DUF169 family)